jgi:hypothetical protein
MKNRKIIWIGCLFSILILFMNACYYDEVIPVDKSIGNVGEMSFSADIIPIFNASCNVSACHAKGGQKPNLSPEGAYNSLINEGYINKTAPENSSLYKWMNGDEAQSMPLSGPNATYNAKVLGWIKQGALNN